MDIKKKTPNKNPHEHHRQRVKSKFIENQYQLEHLSPHQVCEFLLFFSYPRGDVNPQGHALWDRFGSIRNIIDASPEELAEVISPNSVTLIKFISSLIHEYHAGNYNSKNKQVFDRYELQAEFFIQQFAAITVERLCVLCLDSQFHYLKHMHFSNGIISASQIEMKPLISFILSTNATVVLLAHNHPRASLTPSNDDIISTNIIRRMLQRLNVTLYDHIIVSEDQALSMHQLGYFDND